MKFQIIPSANKYLATYDGGIKRCGKAKGATVGRTISPYLNNSGYYKVSVHCNGKKSNRYVHHLILEAFCGPRPKNKFVDHIDGNKLNNRLSNLRYVTRIENMKNAYRNGYSFNRKKVIDIKTGMEFDSVRLASKYFKISENGLSAHLVGKTKSCGGRTFKFVKMGE